MIAAVLRPRACRPCRHTQAATSAFRRNGRSARQPTDTPGCEASRLRHRSGYFAELMTSRDRTVSNADLSAAFSRFCFAFMHLWNAGVPGTSPHSSHAWTSGPGPAAQADRNQRHPKSHAPLIDAFLPPCKWQCCPCSRRWQVACFAFAGVDGTVSGAPWRRWPATGSASVQCVLGLLNQSFAYERSRLLGRFLQSLLDGRRQFFTIGGHCQQVTAGAAILRRLGLPPVVDRHLPQYSSVLWLHSQPIRPLKAWTQPNREKVSDPLRTPSGRRSQILWLIFYANIWIDRWNSQGWRKERRIARGTILRDERGRWQLPG